MRVIKKLTILLLLLLFGIDAKAQTYYAEVNSLKDAQKIGGDQLVSYKDGIAVFSSDVNEDTYQNYIMYPSSYNPNPIYDFQSYYYKEIEFENIYKNNITGKGSVIAIIDTGCDINHSDLRDNIIGCYNSTDIGNEKDVTDKDGHGTFVAGVIAASDNNVGIVGVASEAKLYIIKASYGDGEYFRYSDVIRAINKCVELGNINIINLSLGGYHDNILLKEALENARNHGILIVCAAGNEATSTHVYPASYRIGLSVASSNILGNLSEFSNFGDNSNIVAPGEVISTSPSNDYRFGVGTSYATPLVSGTAGLIFGQLGNMPKNSSTADYIKNIILSNTDNKVYSSSRGSVRGKLNLQNIFKAPIIKSPKKPKVVIKENKRTKQQMITVKSTTDIDIYYSINGKTPFQKLSKTLRLDKKGPYFLQFVAVKRGTKAYSNVVEGIVIVSNDVYSQKYLNSIKLKVNKKKMNSGSSQQIKVKTNGKKIDKKRIQWTSSNPKIAKIDENGNITVANNVSKGKKVKFTAKIGNVKRTIVIQIK